MEVHWPPCADMGARLSEFAPVFLGQNGGQRGHEEGGEKVGFFWRGVEGGSGSEDLRVGGFHTSARS